jgi:hypothetical protein
MPRSPAYAEEAAAAPAAAAGDAEDDGGQVRSTGHTDHESYTDILAFLVFMYTLHVSSVPIIFDAFIRRNGMI